MINRAVKKMSDKKAELDQVKLIIFHRIFLILPITSILRLVTKKKTINTSTRFFFSRSQRSFSICGTVMSLKNEISIVELPVRWDGNEIQGGNHSSNNLILYNMVVSLSCGINTALLKIVFYSQVHLYLYIAHFKATTTGDNTHTSLDII